jgi:hypothetical protein
MFSPRYLQAIAISHRAMPGRDDGAEPAASMKAVLQDHAGSGRHGSPRPLPRTLQIGALGEIKLSPDTHNDGVALSRDFDRKWRRQKKRAAARSDREAFRRHICDLTFYGQNNTVTRRRSL